MEYRILGLSCACGRVPKNISAVGFTSAHDLVIQWRCPRCHNYVCVVEPVSACWRECFAEGSANTPKANVNLTTPDDRRFLHSLGVRDSDE